MDKPELSQRELEARGFEPVCQCALSEGMRLSFSSAFPSCPGVYAFCSAGKALYVGVASRSLARRLYLYTRPGPTQPTNLRLNGLLFDLLSQGGTVDILVASPPDLEWKGWAISAAEGLEAALIRDFNLPWNKRGTTKASANAVRPIGSQVVKKEKPLSQYGGKYGPLRAHLEASGKDRVTMTFRQIEELIGKLPKSASLYLAWWGNHEGNSQAKAWMAAHYLVEANPAGRSVIFRRFSY